MQQFLSKTMPVSVSRRLLEEINNNINLSNSNSNSNSNNSSNNESDNHHMFSSTPQSCSSSRSISPEPTFDPLISGHSLHRKPTFSYIPIHKRRRSGGPTLIRSMSFNSISTSAPNHHSSSPLLSTSTNLVSSIQTPDSEFPTTPTSMFSTHSDQSTEYTSFPNLEKFADECWTEIRVEERKDCMGDLEMESYDEMVVAGVRIQYS